MWTSSAEVGWCRRRGNGRSCGKRGQRRGADLGRRLSGRRTGCEGRRCRHGSPSRAEAARHRAGRACPCQRRLHLGRGPAPPVWAPVPRPRTGACSWLLSPPQLKARNGDFNTNISTQTPTSLCECARSKTSPTSPVLHSKAYNVIYSHWIPRSRMPSGLHTSLFY